MNLKRVNTERSFQIYISHWIINEIIPLATFKDVDNYKVYHLIKENDDAYALISIEEDGAVFSINHICEIPRVVVDVLKELPSDPNKATPLKFIDKIEDIYEE